MSRPAPCSTTTTDDTAVAYSTHDEPPAYDPTHPPGPSVSTASTPRQRGETDPRLRDAARLVAGARQSLLAVGDLDGAARLEALHQHLTAEAELTPTYLWRPVPPAGAAPGWYLRHDPHTRALRRLHGLHVPTN